jgi:UDP-GlcNAc:undecaprenyl-phosphate/decaprenyl-phosphate GlcNAc-1-phosphate transferase
VGAIGAAFAVSLSVALAATLVCERLAPRLGLVVEPRRDRWHRRPVALLGGVAIMLGVLPALALVGGLRGRLAALTLVSLAMGVVGLVDDLRPLRPPVKLVAQIALAAVLVQLDFVLRLTGVPVLDVLLTLLWVVGVTNAFNLLDNMDGLAAGMAVIAGGYRLALFILDGDIAAATMTAGFVGAVTGFLVRNAPPARIFMGDAGSLFLGFFLSGLCLVVDAAYYSRGITAVLAVPVLLVLMPIFDTTFVAITRFLRGQPVSEGGRDHTSHRLVALGGSEWRALGVLCGLSIVGGGVALLTYRANFGTALVLLPLLLVGLALLGIHLSRVEVARASPAYPGRAAVWLVQSLPYKRHVASVVLDTVLIVVAYYAAYVLRFEDAFAANRPMLLRTLAPVLVFQLSGLALWGAYSGIWRYTGLADMLRLAGGITVGTVAGILYLLFTTRFMGLSRAVFVLDWLLLTALVGASRASFRLLGEALRAPRAGAKAVFVYGAGDGGELALRELRNNPALAREAVGFIDDDRTKAGRRIHGVPVLGPLDDLDSLFRTHPVAEVVVASGKIPVEQLDRLEATCAAHGVVVVRASVRLE